jgi:acyl-CoA reductase-like NAD-dependent aldehyde dehydrogenase
MTEVDNVTGLARGAWGKLQEVGFEGRLHGVEAVVQHLCARADVVAVLAADAGLSVENVRWGLDSQLALFKASELERLRQFMPARARGLGLMAVVLPGNVFAASFQGLLLPWLAGVPVVAKLPTRGGHAAVFLAESVAACVPELAATLQVVRFDREDHARVDSLLSQADAVSIYGADSTIVDVRARARADARILPHGHGVSVGWVSKEHLGRLNDADMESLARSIAVDVVAYDQRGCLSPQAVWVEAEPESSEVERLAAALARALEERSALIPVGPHDAHSRAAEQHWRSVAKALGEVHERESFAVSIETELRGSPGRRHLAVVAQPKRASLMEKLRSLGPHLKQVGLAVGDDEGFRLCQALLPDAYPSLVPFGVMQCPPVDTYFDGRAPFVEHFVYEASRP